MLRSNRDGRTISAVVVTYDSAACVGRCIASVKEALPNAELVVVDNGSQDETTRAVRESAPDARLIESGENLGFGCACNVGAEAAQGSYLLLLNPDVVVTAVQNHELHELLVLALSGSLRRCWKVRATGNERKTRGQANTSRIPSRPFGRANGSAPPAATEE
jgi:glycosyltransferase involved in cell wall biosynthesis